MTLGGRLTQPRAPDRTHDLHLRYVYMPSLFGALLNNFQIRRSTSSNETLEECLYRCTYMRLYKMHTIFHLPVETLGLLC